MASPWSRCGRTSCGVRATRSSSVASSSARAPGSAGGHRLGRRAHRHDLCRQRGRRDRRRRRPRRSSSAGARSSSRTANRVRYASCSTASWWPPGSNRRGCASRRRGTSHAGRCSNGCWARRNRRRRSADHEIPRRAAVDRALVRPARDPSRARIGSRLWISTKDSRGSQRGSVRQLCANSPYGHLTL